MSAIAACLDFPDFPGVQPQFRGRPLSYWVSRQYGFARFLPLAGLEVPWSALLLVGVPVLLADGGALCDATAALAATLAADDERVFGAGHLPFQLVGRGFYEKRRELFRPGVFAALRRQPQASPPLPAGFSVVNPFADPLAAEALVVAAQVAELTAAGVTLESFGDFYLDGGVPVGEGSRIGPGAVIRGSSRIGRRVSIAAHCCLENAVIGDGCTLLPGSVVLDSTLEENVQLGPYCHLRMGSLVKAGAKIGNFVEMKKSAMGAGSKAMHLSYIGDATVGERANIGAGTITCNYDGQKKNPTVIDDGVFIGSGTELVAPVRVGRDAYVAAGSTITEDVPENALAVARERQRNIDGWVLRKRRK